MKRLSLTAHFQGRRSMAALALSLLVMLTVLAAGCGGGSDEASTEPAAAEETTVDTGAPAEEEAPADTGAAAETGAAEAAENDLGYIETELRLLGLIDPADVKEGLKVCFFGDGTTNTYVLANNSGAQQAADKLGVDIEIFLGDWDPTRQLNQLEDAIRQNLCDGIILESIDPNVVCNAATEGATDADIPVAVANVPICGDENWTEGTITFSGSQTLDYYLEYTNWVFEQFMERYPEGGKIAAITGPANWSGTIPPYGSTVAYEQTLPNFPDIEMVQVIDSDFTVEGGLNAANTILSTHPDVQGLIVQYDQDANGAVQALKAAGKQPGDVMVWGLGCDHSGVDNVKSGWQQGCFLLEPVEETGHGVEAMIAYLSGVPVCEEAPNKDAISSITPGQVDCIPKFLWTFLDPTLTATFGADASPFVTKENADVITPEW
jgi:ABC-type sugar transport system substrate-binding protein